MFSASKIAGASSGFQIANSLRFRASASAYLSRTPSVAGNRQTWTWSGWVKRGAISQTNYRSVFGGGETLITFYDDATYNSQLIVNLRSAGTNVFLNYAPVFRDASAWYHFVFACDTTQATSSNRFKLYVNGVQITAAGSLGLNYPSQNWNTDINAVASQTIGGGNYFDGYMTEINFIDGQALTPSSFGEIDAVTGVWKAKRYAGTYGTNGFRLNFSNGTSTTTLGYDSSGNGNNWTTNNISLTAGSTYDWMIDSPTKFPGSSYGVGNYAVLNPVAAPGLTAPSNGNLQIVSTVAESGAWPVTMATASPLYFEVQVVSGNPQIGLQGVNGTNPLAYNSWDGNLYSYGSLLANVGVVSSNDLFGIAIFGASNAFQMYKNGSSVYSGTIVATNSIPYVYDVGSGGAINCVLNFGQRPFAYTPPSGYKSLCTQNLPVATIYNGAAYMAATTYTGTGSSVAISNAVNGVSFQPDFVWYKDRSNARDHGLFDSVRGATNYLASNVTNAESTVSGVTAFNSNGFALGSSVNGNGSGETYVAWQWKAGGTAVTNTAGSITSSVSANTTAGFSVVTYTGNGVSTATVGHGLGITPSMIIIKIRSSSAYGWPVMHSSLPTNGNVFLNSTQAYQTTYGQGGIANPASSTTFGFVAGSSGGGQVYDSGSTYVAYCFAAIPGYSAFGSYTGNGSTDGPFVYCGFRPRWMMFKRTETTSNWTIFDTSRNTSNVSGAVLYPNLSDAEGSLSNMDILSNGFKFRATGSNYNASGGTYIYAAFAENPFQNALAR